MTRCPRCNFNLWSVITVDGAVVYVCERCGHKTPADKFLKKIAAS